LFGVFDIVCFNESSPAMNAVMTAPFEMVQITGRVDFPDDFVAIFRLMRRLVEIPTHFYLAVPVKLLELYSKV
jgi:hypothetical protein